MEKLVAALAEHPIRTAPYTSIRYKRRDANGTPIYRVGNVEAGGPRTAMRAAHEQWGSNCFYCGKPMPRDEGGEPCTLDHVQPQGLGGTSDLHNLVFSCRPCNTRKGAAPLASFNADRAADYTLALDRHVTRSLRALSEPADFVKPGVVA